MEQPIAIRRRGALRFGEQLRLGGVFDTGEAWSALKSNQYRVMLVNDEGTASPPSSLTDNGNGTISDNATGLMWMKCSTGTAYIPGTNDCAVGALQGFGWQDALNQAVIANAANYGNALNRAAPAASPIVALTALETRLLEELLHEEPKQRPRRTLSRYLTGIARLGGYLARAKDPPPGNLVMWRGLSRLTDIELGFTIGIRFVGN